MIKLLPRPFGTLNGNGAIRLPNELPYEHKAKPAARLVCQQTSYILGHDVDDAPLGIPVLLRFL